MGIFQFTDEDDLDDYDFSVCPVYEGLARWHYGVADARTFHRRGEGQ